jgi:hypothetical protein
MVESPAKYTVVTAKAVGVRLRLRRERSMLHREEDMVGE